MYMHHSNSGSGNMFHHGLFYIDSNDQDLMQNTVNYFSRDHNPWILYLEMLPPDIDCNALLAKRKSACFLQIL